MNRNIFNAITYSLYDDYWRTNLYVTDSLGDIIKEAERLRHVGFYAGYPPDEDFDQDFILLSEAKRLYKIKQL